MLDACTILSVDSGEVDTVLNTFNEMAVERELPGIFAEAE